MKRYCIIQDATELYYSADGWSEEPEWFSASEAQDIVRTFDDPIAYSTCAHEFSAAEAGVLY